MASKINRFYKTTRYMGVKHQAKDTFGEWREEINLKSWYGRPYNQYEFDEIYEYTPELWQVFVNKAIEQGRATNREVVQGEDYLYLSPIWKHGVRHEVKAEPVFGEADTGIQKGMFGEEKQVTIMGKGKPTQASLEAYGKLQELKRVKIKPEVAPKVGVPQEEAPKNLYWYSIAELREMCRKRRLDTGGSKDDLVRRL